MDGMVTFSLFGNQCAPSSLSLWQRAAHFVFIVVVLLFAAAGVAPPSVYITFEAVSSTLSG